MNKLINLLLIVFLPFVAIYLFDGSEDRIKRVIVSIVLSFVFWVPAVIYAYDVIEDKKWFYPELDKIARKF